MEAIFILNQCNLFIGVVSTAMIALGNLPQNLQLESDIDRSTEAVMIESAYAEYQKPTENKSSSKKNTKNSKDSTDKSDDKKVSESTEPEKEEPVDEYDESCEDDEEYYSPEAENVFYEGFDSSFKAYMDYRCITDTESIQYEMQQQAYTDERGFRRIGDDYCVALGTGFTNGCGERFAIYLDSGYSFTAIVSDVKSDAHTDYTNCYVPRGENSGNVVEFIIDTDYADSSMLSSGSAGYYDDLSGNITAVVPI